VFVESILPNPGRWEKFGEHQQNLKAEPNGETGNEREAIMRRSPF